MKHTTPAHKRERNSEESLVGRAHHALRAYVKALTTRADGASHSFQFSPDRRSASILDSNGQVVLSKSIEELARAGGDIRFALAGLRELKQLFEEKAREEGSTVRARYHLDAMDGEAVLSLDDEPVTSEQLIELVADRYRRLTKDDPVKAALESLAAGPVLTTPAWAKIGAPISALLFLELESAEEYGFSDAAEELRERAYRLGLIRRRTGAGRE